MPLPSQLDINPFDDLDGKAAEEHFLGKSLKEAVLLFNENSLYYQEDFMWMGPKAFCFYIHAVIKYIESDAAVGDSDMANCLQSTIAFRLEHDRQELVSVLRELKEVSHYIISNWSKFDVDPSIYGDLRGKYQFLRDSL